MGKLGKLIVTTWGSYTLPTVLCMYPSDDISGRERPVARGYTPGT